MHNLIFFGSDQYSATTLSCIIESKILSSISIITDRPKPKDRERVIEPNPVEQLAITHKLNIAYYPSLPDELSNLIDIIKIWSIDKKIIGLCASFDHLVPQEIIELFDGQLYNLHPSLLPQYRNVSPVQYALALGDKETGITLFRISTGIDNGQIIAQIDEPILPTDTTASITPRLFTKGAKLFIDFLEGKKSPDYTIHDEPLIFTKRLTRDSGFIEWEVLIKLLTGKAIRAEDTDNILLKHRHDRSRTTDGLIILDDLLRALTPWPGVWSNVPTKKGELRISIESILPELKIKISGKPNPISYTDFEKYYLT